MNNRLGDIPAWALEDSDDDNDDNINVPKNGGGRLGGDGGDIEMANKTKQTNYMEEFFGHVDLIKADIDAVSKASRDISKISEQALLATTTVDENKLSKKLKPLIDATNTRARKCKKLLEVLKEDTDSLKADKKLNLSDVRVRDNMVTTLTRKFVDEMKLYQQAQQQYKTDLKNKVKRQVLIVKPDATDEEVDDVMKSEGGRDALYRERILAGGVNDQIRTTYAKVAGKYQDVLTLEQSVAELHQMFLDFALLTEQQGELLDQIEFQVTQANDYVEEANIDVNQAIEYQKAIRKKQCWIIIIVLVVTGVVAWQIIS